MKPPASDSETADEPWGVATDVFTDHMVLRPPNRLKQRATRVASLRDAPDSETIARAEHALEMLSGEFDGWMEIEINLLEQARTALAAKRDEPALRTLYRASHDLRGQAATFGYPLAGEIADGLCELIERAGTPPALLIDRHVEAIRAIVRENVKDRDHVVGIALTRALAAMRAEIDAAENPPTGL